MGKLENKSNKSKTKAQNLEILQRLRKFRKIGEKYLYIITLGKNLFSPLRSQLIVVFYDRLHVDCTSSPPSISSISLRVLMNLKTFCSKTVTADARNA